jgi:hypothetical protein
MELTNFSLAPIGGEGWGEGATQWS